MPKSTENKLFKEAVKLPNPGLRSYFGNVVKGQQTVYETSFAKGESLESMLSQWSKVLESIEGQWPTLWEYENELREKVGPMSVMKPLRDRMKDIDLYYEGILLPSEPVSERACKAVINEFSKTRGLRLRNQVVTVDMMRKSTNSGTPYFAKKRTVVDDTLPCRVIKDGVTVTQILDGQTWEAAGILGWRGQEGGPKPEDVKQRVVWMFPFAVNIEELRVYQPLIESSQKFQLVPAWVSLDCVDAAITRLFDSKGSSDLVVCTDFSAFDQHFNPSLQEAAHTILRAMLTPEEASESWLTNVFPIKYMIPLIYDWGKVRVGKHGMGSGSGGTNCDETIVHRALQYESAQRKGARLNPNSQCLGDDGILSYPGITVEDVVSSYTAHGLEMNEDKQSAATDYCTYLRRWHHKDYRVDGMCVGVYSTYRALGRLRYMERYQDPDIWNSKAVALRQLSILENVKYHPLKEEFVKFCMKRDKYRLGLDIPNFLDDIVAISQDFIDQMPEFLGYTRSNMETVGIGQWWIVNYLKLLK